MAWTTPKTWTHLELVDESDLNTHIRDNFNIVYPTYGTTLPTSPTNGQQCVITNPAGTGEMWHFRYNTGFGDAYKWQFIGGSDFPGPATTFSHANITTYRFATGTNLTVPFTGIYDVILASYRGESGSLSRAMYTVGVNGVADDTYATYGYGPAHQGLWAVSRRTLTAGQTLNVAYRVVDGSVSFSEYAAHVRLKPVRVG